MIRAVAIVGPTAVGKTAFAIRLAREIGGEIISCDSMQIYKGMDIGTAKATAEERSQIAHHMLDFLAASERYSAADYARDALSAAKDIAARGSVPIFCGGTGLYLDAVRTGRHTETDYSDPEYTARLLEISKSDGGNESLYQMLCKVDPASAEKIHKNNVRRVIRALEIFHMSGVAKSTLDEKSREKSDDIEMLIIGLSAPSREELYARIDARVDKMLANGLVEETRALYENGCLSPEFTAAQAIGYKEILPHITSGVPLRDCVESLKTASRRYAKRQLTWFSSNPDIEWIIPKENGEIPTNILTKIKNFIYGDRI